RQRSGRFRIKICKLVATRSATFTGPATATEMRRVRHPPRERTVGNQIVQKRRKIAFLAAGALSAGCYSLEPAAGITPKPGMEFAWDINDVGRVALGGAMGPEISQVE